MPPQKSSNRGQAIVVVLVTCPSAAQSERLARFLLKERVAACVNILPALRSRYWWRGKIERAAESLLLIKSSRKLFQTLKRVIRRHHPYETPEILALSVAAADAQYRSWVLSCLLGQSS